MADGSGAPVTTETGDEASVTIVNTISIIVLLAYVSFMPLWMFYPPKVSAETLAILNQMMGAWGYAFAAVIGFHLGSSKTAKDAAAGNRDTIKSMASTAAASTAAVASAIAGAAPVSTSGAPATVTTTTETKVDAPPPEKTTVSQESNAAAKSEPRQRP